MPQSPKAWIWTRKVRGKSITLGLTHEKAHKMKLAIANHRAMDKIIDEMREITQKLILEPLKAPKLSNSKIIQKLP